MTGAGHLRSARPAPTRRSPSPSRLPQSRPQVPAPRPQPTTAVLLTAAIARSDLLLQDTQHRRLFGGWKDSTPARTHAKSPSGTPRTPPNSRASPADRGIPTLPPTTPTPGSETLLPPNSGKSLGSLRTVCAQQALVLKQRPAFGGRCGERRTRKLSPPPGSAGTRVTVCTEGGGQTCSACDARTHRHRAGTCTGSCRLAHVGARTQTQAEVPDLVGVPRGAENVYVPRGMAVHTSSPTIQSLTLGKQDAENEGPQDCDDHESQDQEEGSLSPASRVPWDNTNGLLSSSLDPWARRTAPVTWLSPR